MSCIKFCAFQYFKSKVDLIILLKVPCQWHALMKITAIVIVKISPASLEIGSSCSPKCSTLY